MMIKFASVALFVLFCGCMSKVVVDKRPSIALPIYSESNPTNPVEYVIVDQGYKVKYSKIGYNTDIEQLQAEISTNKTVKFSLGGLHSTSITNSFQIKVEDLLNFIKTIRATTNDVDGVVVEN